MRTRWIIIGTVKAEAQLYGHGRRGRGYWMNWRGRPDWCQPNEFETLEQLEWAVRRRLSFARLEVVRMETANIEHPTSNIIEFPPLRVLVKRLMDLTTLKLNFICETELARRYEHPVSGFRQWVPRSVCPKTMKFGDVHEVSIADWWLEQNPFEKKGGPQKELFLALLLLGWLLVSCAGPPNLGLAPAGRSGGRPGGASLPTNAPARPVAIMLKAMMPPSLKEAAVARAVIQTNQIGLAWTASVSTNVIAYRIYYGFAPGVDANHPCVQFGAVTNGVMGLTRTNGQPARWFFAASALDSAGDESDLSNETHWPRIGSLRGWRLTWPTGITNAVTVEASADSISWNFFTNAPGGAGSVEIPYADGVRFFRGPPGLTISNEYSLQ